MNKVIQRGLKSIKQNLTPVSTNRILPTKSTYSLDSLAQRYKPRPVRSAYLVHRSSIKYPASNPAESRRPEWFVKYPKEINNSHLPNPNLSLSPQVKPWSMNTHDCTIWTCSTVWSCAVRHASPGDRLFTRPNPAPPLLRWWWQRSNRNKNEPRSEPRVENRESKELWIFTTNANTEDKPQVQTSD